MDETNPHQPPQQPEQIGPADLLVGILDAGPHNEEAPGSPSKGAAMLRDAVEKLRTPVETVVVDSSLHEAASFNGAGKLKILPAGALGADTNAPAQGIAASYRRVFALGQQVDAKACCVISSALDTVTWSWFYWLTQPVLELGYDLVTPCYVHGPFEGLLNASIISPLHSALYGHNLQNPLGPDVGLSRQALARVLDDSHLKTAELPLVSLTALATGSGLKLCQAWVGRRVYPSTDWSAVSSLLPPILGPIFGAIEQNAAVWQRVRGLRQVMTLGEADRPAMETEGVDRPRMIESFQLAIRDLREIYSLVLPPSTLLELTKLARLGPDQFQMPDALWARIIYDFAAAYRGRTLNRDHLLRALTPLYLGWVASYSLEVQNAGSYGAAPLARLIPAFEAAKPYFVSRWRWPDRFNP